MVNLIKKKKTAFMYRCQIDDEKNDDFFLTSKLSSFKAFFG